MTDPPPSYGSARHESATSGSFSAGASTTDRPPTATPPPTDRPDVPPLTAAAWRYRLVRPVEGRTFAGVCGALGRATDTDPVLWRVVLVVLTLFFGIGVVVYLIGWLLLPADGDTATPVEALGGRGHSRTSTPRTIVGLVVVALFLAGYMSDALRATPLIAALLLGVVLLLLVRDRSRERADPAAGPQPPSAVAPPFAPHGPFAPTHPGPLGPPVFPPVFPPPRTRPVGFPPPPPQPQRPRSKLGLLTLSIALLVLGGLVAADLVEVAVPAVAYFAAPLAVLGAGLVVGAWYGRARWLIPLGIALSLAVGGGVVALDDGYWTRPSVGQLVFTPDAVADIDESYHRNIGEIVLDLSDVDFSGRDIDVTMRVDIGSLVVTLPSDVDVVVDAAVDVGAAEVLGEEWSGLGNRTRTVSDLGEDGVGGGRLHISAGVGIGSMEVNR